METPSFAHPVSLGSWRASRNTTHGARRVRPARVARPYSCATITSNGEDQSVGSEGADKMEGAMNASAVDGDTGLQAALSRSWDKLSALDGVTDLSPFAENAHAEEPVFLQPAVITHEETEENFSLGSDAPSSDIATDPMVGLDSFPTPTAPPKDNRATITQARPGRTGKTKRVRKKMVDVTKRDGFLEEAKKHAAVWDSTPRWFFLQVKPGCEQSCAISLRNLGRSLPELGVRDVMVPAMKIMRLNKAGKSVNREERIYPSYILIHMCMNFESYNRVQSVPNVQFFMGDPNRDKKKKDPFMPPVPISDRELANVFERMKTAEKEKPESRTILRPGNSIRVLDGEYEGIYATILEVKPDLNLVTVELVHYARKIKAELGISSVVKEEAPKKEEVLLEELKGTGVEAEDDDEFAEATVVGEKENDGGAEMARDDDDGFVDASVSNDDDLLDNIFGTEEKTTKKKSKRMPTVLDVLDGPEMTPAAVDEDFDDLFVDDLPDIPMSTGGGGRRNKRGAAKGTKDPVQDLLDLFGDEDIGMMDGGKDDGMRNTSGTPK